MAPQAYAKPPQAPPLFNGNAKSVVKDMEDMIAKSKGLMDQLVKDVEEQDATFEDVLLPMALQDNEDGLTQEVLVFYQAVSEDPALRDASTEAQKLIKDFSVEASMREDVFRLVKAAYEKKNKLDPESSKLLEESYKDYIRRGMALPTGPQRDRYKEIQLKLGGLETDFERNLAEEKGGIWFDPKEVEGIPPDLVSTWEKGEGENEGKVKMNFQYPNYFPTLKNAFNADTRKRAYIENTNKMLNNQHIFKEVIALRDEAARILEFPNHAAMRIENKMAKTPKTVNDFLSNLRQKLTEGGESERKVLTETKKQDLQARGRGDSFDGHYF
ncbi:MAG: hypothetical protein Q9164_006852, partial [Protoblastenia rupestris]